VTTAQQQQRQPAEAAKLDRRQYLALKQAQAIRDRYADGQPLGQQDHTFVLGLLQQHPRAAAKIGPGVAAITADRFVGGSRCFFAIRTDGSAEDFSVAKCLGQTQPRTARVRALMASFRYEQVVAHFRRALATRGAA
jgi:hypothetical protein